MVTEDAFWQFHVKRWEHTTYSYCNLQQGTQVLDCNLIYLKGSELRDAEFKINIYKKKNHIITIYEFMSPFSINSACHKLVEKHLNGDRMWLQNAVMVIIVRLDCKGVFF